MNHVGTQQLETDCLNLTDRFLFVICVYANPSNSGGLKKSEMLERSIRWTL